MSRAGNILLVAGLLIIAASLAQLFLAVAFGTDPNSNYLGNGLLTYFGCIVGGIVTITGVALGVGGRASAGGGGTRRPG